MAAKQNSMLPAHHTVAFWITHMVLFAPEHPKGRVGYVLGVFVLFVTEETAAKSSEERKQCAEGSYFIIFQC